MNSYSYDDILNLSHERKDVDFKRSIPWDKDHKYEIIKDVLAFSNASGGIIVIGVDEDNNHKPIKRGILQEHEKTWKTTIVNRDVNNYCEPPIEIIFHIHERDNKRFLFLHIPPHTETPRICKKKFENRKNTQVKVILKPGAIYFRNANRESTEIRDYHDWKELLHRCFVHNKEFFISTLDQLLSGQLSKPSFRASDENIAFQRMDEFKKVADDFKKPQIAELDLVYQEYIVYPLQAISPIDPIIAKKSLITASQKIRFGQNISFSIREEFGPFGKDDGISVYIQSPPIGNPDSNVYFNYWRFLYGGIFYAYSLTPESVIRQSKKFDPFVQSRNVAAVLSVMGTLFMELGLKLDTEIFIMFRYNSIPNFHLDTISHLNTINTSTSMVFSDKYLTEKTTRRLSSLINEPSQIAAEFIVQMMDKFGYEGNLKESYFIDHIDKFLENPRPLI
jgi:hypothetical protein